MGSRDGETKSENTDKVMTMHEPAGRLGEIVRTLKRNHQARMQSTLVPDENTR